MRLEKRLEALEHRLTKNPIKLTFADGKVITLHLSGDELTGLFAGSLRDGAELHPYAKLLMEAISVEEADGHLCELFSAVYRSPFPEISESKGGLLQ